MGCRVMRFAVFCTIFLQVSWLRRGGGNHRIDLLTVGDSTYTGDRRINVSYQ